ncbi:MAG TPA: YHS domain-containing protein [Marmoricola sp.]|nr:YHS domain-containing protein [Marmoricola sp.]
MEDATLSRDPSCGMTVDPTTAPARVEYRQTRYHFCSQHCADAFALDPKKFLRHPPRSNLYRLAGQ